MRERFSFLHIDVDAQNPKALLLDCKADDHGWIMITGEEQEKKCATNTLLLTIIRCCNMNVYQNFGYAAEAPERLGRVPLFTRQPDVEKA